VTTFSVLSNVLPDPNYKIGTAGESLTTGSPGPGFASVKLTNDQKMMVTRTNSQRLIARSTAGQKWKVDISYHPMTRDEFEPVYTFLLQQKGPLTPFFISLPQYRVSRNAAWHTNFVTKTFSFGGGTPNAYQFTTTGGGTAGTSVLKINVGEHPQYTGEDYTTATNAELKTPRPGDMITLDASAHKKAYLITGVETLVNYRTSQTIMPTNSRDIKLTVSPPFVKNVVHPSTVQFSNPLIKVVQPKPVAEYSLNTDNLYSFSLKLEEYL